MVEDKTFGLKNKNKSKAVQKYVAEVTKGAKMAGMSKDDFVRKQKEAEERNEKKGGHLFWCHVDGRYWRHLCVLRSRACLVVCVR